MRLGLPISLRSFAAYNCCRYNSNKTAAPLNILFCGSDEFSITSLRALNRKLPSKLIESINVVHRPGKPTGRGQKQIRDVPIKAVAEELNLQTHEIDTFTGWTPPGPIDLIIAVSFGLFVPARLLNIAKYGGLNVHPSLLPDLRGPAPIQHTLLKQRPKTGITVQTLHPEHFDGGLILAQTPPPGLHVPDNATTLEMISTLGEEGANMLIRVLESRNFVPPLKDTGWYGASSGPIDYAPKIEKSDSYIDISLDTAQEIMVKHRTFGDLWCTIRQLPNNERIIFHKITPMRKEDTWDRTPGLHNPKKDHIRLRTIDGVLLKIISCTISGGKKGIGHGQLAHLLANSDDILD